MICETRAPNPESPVGDGASGTASWRRLVATIATMIEESATEIDSIGARLVGECRDGAALQGLDLQRQKLTGLARALEVLDVYSDQSEAELHRMISGVINLEELRRSLFGELRAPALSPVELF